MSARPTRHDDGGPNGAAAIWLTMLLAGSFVLFALGVRRVNRVDAQREASRTFRGVADCIAEMRQRGVTCARVIDPGDPRRELRWAPGCARCRVAAEAFVNALESPDLEPRPPRRLRNAAEVLRETWERGTTTPEEEAALVLSEGARAGW